MSFISDLFVEISSFRIRVGNKLNALANRIGDLTALTTSNKTDLVGAINEVNDNIPTSSDYITTNTTQTGLSGNKSVDGTWTFNSQINTTNHGNSSQWFESYQNVNPLILSWNTTNNASSSGHTHELAGDVFARIISDLNQNYDLNDIGDNYRSGFAQVASQANAQTALNYPWDGGGGNLLNFNTGQTYKTQIFHNRAGSRIAYRSKINGTTYRNWVEFITDLNLDSQATSLGFIKSASLSGYVPTSRTITAGNGLSGGGNLTANRTITLGTPGAITLSSTNSVGTSTHTHAFTPGGTTAQYIRGDGSLATFPTISDTITRLRGTASGTYTSGDLTLLAGANTTITQSGANITIASTNTNTTYTAGTGLSLSGTTFGQAITTSGSGTYVQSITQTASGFQVNLGTPPNTNTTYSAGTLALLQAGTNATNRVWSASILAQRFTEINNRIVYYRNSDENVDSDVVWGTNIITGRHIQVQGGRNIVKGDDINVFGSRNVSSGINNQINGFANVANGAFNTINGAYSSINGSQANIIGNYLFARDKQTVLGMYNKVYDIGTDEGLRFAFGTGDNDFDKFNAVEIYDDHRTEFHGKAAYNEETRNPEWFTEDYTHVDTYQMGYDHLTHRANSSTPCEHNIFEVAVRNNHSGTHERFVRVDNFELAFDIHGIVKGNHVENTIDDTKVHTKGTLEFSNAVRLQLLEKAEINKNPYLVVEYVFEKEEIYVKYVDAFYLRSAKSQNDRVVYIIGSFINKRGSSSQPDTTYFEFNQQII